MKLKEDFDIPFYIFEELAEYIQHTASGKCRCMKWENIKALLRLAIVNKRITREQANLIESKYCKENKKIK